jgi:hypothetical protein
LLNFREHVPERTDGGAIKLLIIISILMSSAVLAILMDYAGEQAIT